MRERRIAEKEAEHERVFSLAERLGAYTTPEQTRPLALALEE